MPISGKVVAIDVDYSVILASLELLEIVIWKALFRILRGSKRGLGRTPIFSKKFPRGVRNDPWRSRLGNVPKIVSHGTPSIIYGIIFDP